jgi:hypothetical protein
VPKRLLVSALALVALMAASPARAHDLAPFLRDHRDLPQVHRLIALHERLQRMIARYEVLERLAGHAWIQVVDAEHDVADALATSGAGLPDLTGPRRRSGSMASCLPPGVCSSGRSPSSWSA